VGVKSDSSASDCRNLPLGIYRQSGTMIINKHRLRRGRGLPRSRFDRPDVQRWRSQGSWSWRFRKGDPQPGCVGAARGVKGSTTAALAGGLHPGAGALRAHLSRFGRSPGRAGPRISHARSDGNSTPHTESTPPRCKWPRCMSCPLTERQYQEVIGCPWFADSGSRHRRGSGSVRAQSGTQAPSWPQWAV
jgi:hypothetical protein